MRPALFLLIVALLLAACQPASDGVSTPRPEPPTSKPAPTETPPTRQPDIATLTATLQSQLDETCQADPLLCQAYEAYKNSRQTDPLHSLALGLLEMSTDSDPGGPPFTLAVDPINGEPVVYLDSAEGAVVALLRPAIGGDEGYLFISTSPYGENARISHEGPCLANAYDEDGKFLGGVSASTGQWVDASELTQADRKAMIAFTGQMELLAQQVVEGKFAMKDLQFTLEQRAAFDEVLQNHPEIHKLIEQRAAAVMAGELPMEEALAGLTIEQRMDLSQQIINATYPEKTNLRLRDNIFNTVHDMDGRLKGLPRSFFALPYAIDEEGLVVIGGPEGEMLHTGVTMEFFTDKGPTIEIIENNTAHREVKPMEPERANGLLPGMNIFTSVFFPPEEVVFIPTVVVPIRSDETTHLDPMPLWTNILNQTLSMGIRVALPYFDENGDVPYFKVVILEISTFGLREGSNWDSVLSNSYFQDQAGIRLDRIQQRPGTCLRPVIEEGKVAVAIFGSAFNAVQRVLNGEVGSTFVENNAPVMWPVTTVYCPPASNE
jgi:hypothetical protein